MELSLKINAHQLVNKEDAEDFLGCEIKNRKGEAFALVPYQGTFLKVNEGYWLVEYHDGTREVWSTGQIKANTTPCKTYMVDLDALEKVAGDKNITPEEAMELVFKTGVEVRSVYPNESIQAGEEVHEEAENQTPQPE